MMFKFWRKKTVKRLENDMVDIIEEYQPEIWYHGHTHQCDDQMIGKTRIISNQFGYVGLRGNAECKEFDSDGMLTEI